eukprot:796124-Prymnesium_polylepis.1
MLSQPPVHRVRHEARDQLHHEQRSEHAAAGAAQDRPEPAAQLLAQQPVAHRARVEREAQPADGCRQHGVGVGLRPSDARGQPLDLRLGDELHRQQQPAARLALR